MAMQVAGVERLDLRTKVGGRAAEAEGVLKSLSVRGDVVSVGDGVDVWRASARPRTSSSGSEVGGAG